jgi:hypothetical protein
MGWFRDHWSCFGMGIGQYMDPDHLTTRGIERRTALDRSHQEHFRIAGRGRNVMRSLLVLDQVASIDVAAGTCGRITGDFDNSHDAWVVEASGQRGI